MFVSQACEACPPAARYLTELSDRSDVVALAWHVDYWDNVRSRAGGSWKDPFASPEYSERQRQYNQHIRGRRSVFTPQAVINGAQSIVGSKRTKIDRMIADGQTETRPLTINFSSDEEKATELTIENFAPEYEINLIRFYKKVSTPIRGGSNAGTIFVNANVVNDVKPITRQAQSSMTVPLEKMEENMGCAVLVHHKKDRRVLASAYCPE